MHLLFLEVALDDVHCKKLLCAFCAFWPDKWVEISAEGCSGCSIGGVCSIFITMPEDIDAMEVDAIAVAESVDVFIFLLAFFAKGCC